MARRCPRTTGIRTAPQRAGISVHRYGWRFVAPSKDRTDIQSRKSADSPCRTRQEIRTRLREEQIAQPRRLPKLATKVAHDSALLQNSSTPLESYCDKGNLIPDESRITIKSPTMWRGFFTGSTRSLRF